MPLKLNRIKPKGGSALEVGKLIILVGPNNSGKSQTLRDIRDFIIAGSVQRLTILEALEVDLPTKPDAILEVSQRPHSNPGLTQLQGVASDLQNRGEATVPNTWIDQQFGQVHSEPVRNSLLEQLGKFWCAFLDAESRFRLAAATDSYDTRSEAPSNALQAFFSRRAEAGPEIRIAFKNTFSMDIALDWAAMKRLYLKVGPNFGTIPETLEGLDVALKDAQDLSQQGDGYKSFTGVLLALLAFPNRLLMLDEPEAFLHPAQARALGRWIAEQANKRPAQVILASHSADFLLGVISADPAATVVRLNRSDTGTAFHQVPTTTTSGLINSPLLSSQPVLDSLFHKGVVVCEGDPDRALYQTVLHQFLRAQGGEEVLLIHSNGKDAAKIPIEMLRSSRTPVCAIVDIDVLNSAEVIAGIIMALTGAPVEPQVAALRDSIATAVENAKPEDLLLALVESVSKWLELKHTDLRRARKALVTSAKIKSRWEGVKSKGVEYFEGANRQSVDELLMLLRQIGVFVVPVGELEGWMKLGIAKGGEWNRIALEQLHAGNCPPALKDFMGGVLRFLGVSK